jgi:Domain of unknown function (DUF4920)
MLREQRRSRMGPSRGPAARRCAAAAGGRIACRMRVQPAVVRWVFGVVLGAILGTGTAATAGEDPRRYGAPIGSGESIPIATLLSAAERYADRPVVVEGIVRRVCQRRGCWLEIATTPEATAPGCRMTFKDYGFFVPADAIGARVRAEGRVRLTNVPAAQVAHLEQEGATFAGKRPDGTASEAEFVAGGVELR